MWSGSSSSSSSGTDMSNIDPANMTSAQRDTVMESVKAQVALVQAQELIQRLSDKCIRKCIQKPGTSLDKYDKQCLSSCVDRFVETWSAVSQTYQQRLQSEAGGGGMAGGFS